MHICICVRRAWAHRSSAAAGEAARGAPAAGGDAAEGEEEAGPCSASCCEDEEGEVEMQLMLGGLSSAPSSRASITREMSCGRCAQMHADARRCACACACA